MLDFYWYTILRTFLWLEDNYRKKKLYAIIGLLCAYFESPLDTNLKKQKQLSNTLKTRLKYTFCPQNLRFFHFDNSCLILFSYWFCCSSPLVIWSLTAKCMLSNMTKLDYLQEKKKKNSQNWRPKLYFSLNQ